MQENVKHFIYLPSDRKRLENVVAFYSDEILSKMLKENVRLMAEYYNLDIAEAEIQQKRLCRLAQICDS